MILQTFLLALVLRSSLVSGTEFHLSPRQARSGRSLDIVFTDPFQPLCTNPANMNHLELFGHHVCTSAGYKTFSDLVFAHISNIKVDLSEESTEVVVSLEVPRHSPLRHFSSSGREGVGFNQT